MTGVFANPSMYKREVRGKRGASASRRPDSSVGWSYPARRAATVPTLWKDADPTFLSQKKQGGARKAAVAAGGEEAVIPRC